MRSDENGGGSEHDSLRLNQGFAELPKVGHRQIEWRDLNPSIDEGGDQMVDHHLRAPVHRHVGQQHEVSRLI